jgi:hypothetical protein
VFNSIGLGEEEPVLLHFELRSLESTRRPQLVVWRSAIRTGSLKTVNIFCAVHVVTCLTFAAKA